MINDVIDPAQAQLLESIHILRAVEFWVAMVAILAWAAVIVLVGLRMAGRKRI